MIGMDRNTGRMLAGWDHIRQSVQDIVTTRTGTRLERRDYGSAAVDLIDRPGNGEAVLQRYAAIAVALDSWEPRVQLIGFSLVSSGANGDARIAIELADLETGNSNTVEVAA